MASIFKSKLKDGKGFRWRAVIRKAGSPKVCDTFERKQEAEDWARDTEHKMKIGEFKHPSKRDAGTMQTQGYLLLS